MTGRLIRISPYAVWMLKNEDQNNSEYEYFLRCGKWFLKGET